MSATKKGIIGAVIGAIVLVVTMLSDTDYSFEIVSMLTYVAIGALYGFGYAFGWKYMKTTIGKAFGIAAGASILTILFSKRDTGLKVFFIYLFALACGIAIAWIPGTVKGIQLIVAENRG